MNKESGARASRARCVASRQTPLRPTPLVQGHALLINMSKTYCGTQSGSAARDAPHRDRDGRAPQTSRSCPASQSKWAWRAIAVAATAGKSESPFLCSTHISAILPPGVAPRRSLSAAIWRKAWAKNPNQFPRTFPRPISEILKVI